MIERIGNIVAVMTANRWVVVPTNIGWRKDGANPMGVGIAAIAAGMYHEPPAWYGMRCWKYRADTAVCPYRDGKLILFPTKPLDLKTPSMSWQAKADLQLIKRSAAQLQIMVDYLATKDLVIDEVTLPLVGCGAGGLDRDVVVPILREHLDDRFILMERHEKLGNRSHNRNSKTARRSR